MVSGRRLDEFIVSTCCIWLHQGTDPGNFTGPSSKGITLLRIITVKGIRSGRHPLRCVVQNAANDRLCYAEPHHVCGGSSAQIMEPPRLQFRAAGSEQRIEFHLCLAVALDVRFAVARPHIRSKLRGGLQYAYSLRRKRHQVRAGRLGIVASKANGPLTRVTPETCSGRSTRTSSCGGSLLAIVLEVM